MFSSAQNDQAEGRWCLQVRGILTGAQEELRQMDERQSADSAAARELADLTLLHHSLQVCLEIPLTPAMSCSFEI